MAGKSRFDVEHQLYDLLAESNRVPFLFVGSGISQRYMKTEGWEDLLKWVCSSVGNTMRPFYFYKQRASADSQEKNSVYPRMASLMEKDFLEATISPKFSSWTKKNERLFESGVSPMKVYIADHLKAAKPTRLRPELNLLKQAARHVSGVITTNYDNLMETVFPSYEVYSTEEELLFSPLSGIGEIYKIHGSMDDPESMVLDEQDYKKFEERRNYLMAKIFTVFGEYPIIFLGYSLGDQDIKELLSSIALCAGERKVEEMSKRFIFIKYSNTPCIPSINPYRQNLDQNHDMTMTQVTAHDFSFVYKAIGKTNQLYAPQILGQLSKQIFKANDANTDAESTVFIDFNQLSELPQDKKIVIGLRDDDYGKPISVNELYEDAVLDNKNFDPNLVVSDYLEKLLPGNKAGLPIFKYIRQCDDFSTNGNIQKEIIKRAHGGYESYSSPTLLKQKEKFQRQQKNYKAPSSIHMLITTYKDIGALRRLTYLDEKEISLDELEQLLKRILREMPLSNPDTESQLWQYRSETKRCIRIFDYMKYGKAYLKNKHTIALTSAESSTTKK